MGPILIADDHDALRRGLVRALQEAGHDVDEAPHGNAAIEKLHESYYDVVLSDMAPRTTGNRHGDQARSYELFIRALAVAEKLLKPGGAFVGKIFMGEDFKNAQTAVKRLFTEERAIKPEGTRSSSYELFLIGLGKKIVGASNAASQ